MTSKKNPSRVSWRVGSRVAGYGALLLLCSIALAPIGPQGELIRENAQRMRERGFLLVDGKWVEPQMTLRWSELVRFERQGTDVQLVPALSEKLLERFKNNRQVLAAVGPDGVPFQINASLQWINGRQEQGVWLQLRAVPDSRGDTGAESSDWKIQIVNIDPRQFTIIAQRGIENGHQRHSIAARQDNRITVMTNDFMHEQHANRALGQVVLQQAGADLTALLAEPDDAMAWRSWDVLGLLTDGGPHPMSPLDGDMVEASDAGASMDQVRALLPRMVDRSGAVRASASAELAALGSEALPAALQLLDGALLPEQRARLESFIAEHALYRDDPIDPNRLRAMRERS